MNAQHPTDCENISISPVVASENPGNPSVPSHAQLPPELIALILAHLDRKTLLECCTVSRIYYICALRIIYRDLRWTTIRFPAYTRPGHGHLGPVLRLDAAARWMRLVRRLAHDPHVASLVKCFSIVAAHRMWKLTRQGMDLLRDAIGNLGNLEVLEVIGMDRNSSAAFTWWTGRLNSESVTSVHMISCVHIAALAAPTYLPSIRELLFISCSIPAHLTAPTAPSLLHISRLGCNVADVSLPAFLAAHPHIPHLIFNSAPATSKLAKSAAAQLAEVYLSRGWGLQHLELQTHHGYAIVLGFVEAGAAHLLDGRLTVDPAKCGPVQMPMVLHCLSLLPNLRHVVFTRYHSSSSSSQNQDQHLPRIRATYLGDTNLFEDTVRPHIPQIIRSQTALDTIELEDAVRLCRRVTSEGVEFVSQRACG